MLKTIWKAFLVTATIVAVSQIVSFAARWSNNQPFTMFVFVMNAILPVLTAFPTALYIFWQHDRLRSALAELSAAHTLLERRATVDHLTGLLNREAFLTMVRAVRRESAPEGALLLLDVDHFKSVNDTYGHAVGDEALVAISNEIAGSLRDGDLAGRIGGEEFAVYLPAGTSLPEAADLADRIRQRIERLPFGLPQGQRHVLTVSIGIAAAAGGVTFAQVMRAADRNLYEAKDRGRNTVVS
ncbi:GGDEF domain-containing protein [Microvirga antarctica]|uniref:GGDEF domain-containing protein n=1 Tax=Microvirga antarctica TaxID=2819233 RepID=UPI001B30C24D|nr:GGDEF domain-containing protein [Microvirga antarctica]